MGYLDRIAECRGWRPERYRPFVIAGARLGWMGHGFAKRLADFPSVFEVSERAVTLSPALGDFDSRTAAVAEVLRDLVGRGAVPGWRDERHVVTPRWDAPPLLAIERAAVPLFGCRGYGVHLNGLVAGAAGLGLWVARRSATKETAPGKLDHLVAGGQPHGLGVRDNLIKECAEEAAIPRALARRAVAAGVVSYRCERPEGLRDDVLFCFDLDLPADFAPRNTDGEVEWFQLWPIEDVLARIRETDDFKFNCALVILDLAVRRGLIERAAPYYDQIVQGLRLPADIG